MIGDTQTIAQLATPLLSMGHWDITNMLNLSGVVYTAPGGGSAVLY